ncbi:MAG: hypothetical protein AUK28_09515 [Desulfobacterales bacterium CG2_30_60_27]|nr:MAG: hypothetical protein AUK28_09515 [Desulfobacterales bacterium CG2_30_60_27]
MGNKLKKHLPTRTKANMELILDILKESWHLLEEASVYMLFGLLVGGLLKVFLSPTYVARHLGHGRFLPVFKAALFGIPLPLCSCGVLPAAAALKRQGANNGAITAFLISTPESGVDSMAITYALLDPIMTMARPVAAFCTAVAAGIAENLCHPSMEGNWLRVVDNTCQVDGCCDGLGCPPEEHARHHSFAAKLMIGTRYAFTELWGELAGWFIIGLLLAGIIAALVPTAFLARHLGGGLTAMLAMLALGIPMYICATASTPIAAALILKGVSPGAALVFLLAGPATNVTSLAVLFRILGRRATLLYLFNLSIFAVAAGLFIDRIYQWLGITPAAVIGQAAEVMPVGIKRAAALLLVLLSIRPIFLLLARLRGPKDDHGHHHATPDNTGCGCTTESAAAKVAPPPDKIKTCDRF